MTSYIRRIALGLVAPVLLASCINTSEPSNPNGFLVTIPGADSLIVRAGTSANFNITLNRQGTFDGPVTVAAFSVPINLNITLTPSIIPTGATSAVMKITADSSIGSGNSSFGLRFSGDPNYGVALTVPITTISLTGARATRVAQ